MKVKGYKTETVEVEINPKDVIVEIRDLWMRQKAPKYGATIWNGNWEVNYHTSHSWDEKIRPVTEEEAAVMAAFETVLKTYQGLKK